MRLLSLQMLLVASALLARGAVDTPPSILDPVDYTTQQGIPTGPILFTVWDAETPADRLSLRLISSDHGLVPEVDACEGLNPGFCFSGSGSNRAVTLFPAPDRFGGALIELIVADDAGVTATNSFWLYVIPEQTFVFVSSIHDQVVAENSSTPPISFRVEAFGFPIQNLGVVGISSDPALIPDTNLVFAGTGTNRTITITPTPNRFGTTMVTVVAFENGGAAGATTFRVTVKGRLHIALEGVHAVVAWTATNASLQQAINASGPWSDVSPSPRSPYTVTAVEKNFYRLRTQ